MNGSSQQLADKLEQRRRLLLHLKCLVWCLHQTQTRYDLNLVLYSLEHGVLHPEILDSNLGDNLNYLTANLESQDLDRVSAALRNLPETIGSIDVADKNLEIAHYIESLHEIGPVPPGSYGIISSITPRPRGLFWLDDDLGRMVETPFNPADVRTIFGTYIV